MLVYEPPCFKARVYHPKGTSICFPMVATTSRGTSRECMSIPQKRYIYIQGGPLLVINGVINPYKWPYKWVTGVITPISGVIALLITGRGPTL